MLTRWGEILREAGLDSEENRALISHHFYSRFADDLVKVFEILRDNNLFSQETYSATFIEAACASKLPAAILDLKNANLLTQENCLVLLGNAGDANQLSDMIIYSEQTRPQRELLAQQISVALAEMYSQQLLPVPVTQSSMSIDEIITLIRSEEFLHKVFGLISVSATDVAFYQKTFHELSAAYQALINVATFSSAEIEFALGGLCKRIAVNQNSKLSVGSVHEQIAALEASDKDFNNASQYFETAMQSINRASLPCFEANKFRLKIAEQLAGVHELMANRYKNLDLIESAIIAFDKQIQALSQCSQYLSVVESEKKKQITMQILQIEAIKKELKLIDAFSQLFETLDEIAKIIFEEDKLHKALDKMRALANLPNATADFKGLIFDFYIKGSNFNSALMGFVTDMKPIAEDILTALKHKDRDVRIDASIFTFLQGVTQTHTEFKNEINKFNTYLAKNFSKEEIDGIQIEDIKTLETELELLLISCREVLVKIKLLKEAENTKTKSNTIPLTTDTEQKLQTTLRM